MKIACMNVHTRGGFGKGGGGGNRLCACSTHASRARSMYGQARLRALEGLRFRCSLVLSEPYFEAFSYKKKHSRSKTRGRGSRLLGPLLDPLLHTKPIFRGQSVIPLRNF